MERKYNIRFFNKFSILSCFIMVLFSLITGFSISAVYLTNGNIHDFCNTGDIVSFTSNEICSYSTNLSIDDAQLTVTDDISQFVLYSMRDSNSWKHMKIKISNLNYDAINLHFYYFTYDNKLIGDEIFTLTKGNNLLQLSTDSFSYLLVSIESQKGVSFSIDQFQWRTMLPKTSTFALLGYGLILSLVCFIICIIIQISHSGNSIFKNWYLPIQSLQLIFIRVGKHLRCTNVHLTTTVRSYCRIFLLTLMFIVLSLCNVYGQYFSSTSHNLLMLYFAITFILLAVLSIESELKLQNWKNPLVASWFMFWILACISDFVVTKKRNYFSFYGYFVLLIIGFLFFVWNNMKNRRLLLWELSKVIELTFGLCILFCILFRPEIPGFRYNGLYTNPNPFGLYLSVAGCFLLRELDECIQKEKWKKTHLFLYCCGLCALIFFLYKSQCTTASVALVFICILWLLRYIICADLRIWKKNLSKVLLLLALCCLPVFVGLNWSINTIPHAINHIIVFPKDSNYASIELPDTSMTVYAAEKSPDAAPDTAPEYDTSNRILQKLLHSPTLNSLLSGRLNNYISYFRDMNLFGHSRLTRVYLSSSNYAHNGIISYMHTYGVYILIPYLLMNIYLFIAAYKYMKQVNKISSFSFLPLSVFIVFFLENMMDNVDFPFHWIIWFVTLLIGGILFTSLEDNHQI